MIELTNLEGRQIFLDHMSIEYVDQEEHCSIIGLTSGNKVAVKQAASEVYIEIRIIQQ